MQLPVKITISLAGDILCEDCSRKLLKCPDCGEQLEGRVARNKVLEKMAHNYYGGVDNKE